MSERTPDEILEYCEAATEGPWESNRGDCSLVISDEDGEPWDDTFFKQYEDAEFCAYARDDLPRMARRVKELEVEVEEAKRRAKHEKDCAFGMIEKVRELTLALDVVKEGDAKDGK